MGGGGVRRCGGGGELGNGLAAKRLKRLKKCGCRAGTGGILRAAKIGANNQAGFYCGWDGWDAWDE